MLFVFHRYYQPDPDAVDSPYPANTTLNDPTFTECPTTGNCDAWGMRILDSEDIIIYGAGFYSFFDDYSTTCSDEAGSENCQSLIFDIDNSTDIYVYNLNTVGSTSMVYVDDATVATYSDNVNVFPDTIAIFQTS